LKVLKESENGIEKWKKHESKISATTIFTEADVPEKKFLGDKEEEK